VTILVDSDWIIDALAAIPSALDVLASLDDQELAVSAITVAEVLEGAHGEQNPIAQLSEYSRFLDEFSVLPVTATVAEQFAWLRPLLRRQGDLIPDMDLLIASTALSHDLILLTRNIRHFERVPGLNLYRS
jgi:tRNA(fMet)-specific endonuclease VapC